MKHYGALGSARAVLSRFHPWRVTLVLAVCAVATVFSLLQPAAASTLALEWRTFRSLCIAVDVVAPAELENAFDVNAINTDLAVAIETRLRGRGLSAPVESGRQCFPGKVGIAPYQLALQFHITLAPGPDQRAVTTAALIMHTHFREVRNPAHEYPTDIFYCDGERHRVLSTCLTQRALSYFDITALKLIERAQELANAK